MDDKLCPKCGNELEESAKVCLKCGYVDINARQNNIVSNDDKSAFSNNNNSVFVFNEANNKPKRKFEKAVIMAGITGFLVGGLVGAVVMNSINMMNLFSETKMNETNEIKGYHPNSISKANSSVSEVEKIANSISEEGDGRGADLNNIAAQAGEEMDIVTEYGKFTISIMDASEVGWQDLVDGHETQKIISLNCVVNNIDYDNGVQDGIYLGQHITVEDEDGFLQEHYDIVGFDNGEYQLNYRTPIGSKAKVGVTYFVPKNCEIIKVKIDNQFELAITVA